MSFGDIIKNDVIKSISAGFTNFRFADAVDILIVALLLMWLIVFAKKSRAYQLLRGVAIVFIVSIISQICGFNILSWLLDSLLSSGILVIAIIFQPELRRALEHIGRGSKLFYKGAFDARPSDNIFRAIMDLSKRRIGALIIFEQRISLENTLTSGTKLDALISAELIENLFEPNTPLHDGALLIHKDRIVAAGYVIPLTGDVELPGELGTRHRAAVSVTMLSDCVSLVVSEETGCISYAREGVLYRDIDAKELLTLLSSLFAQEENEDAPQGILQKFRRRKENRGKTV